MLHSQLGFLTWKAFSEQCVAKFVSGVLLLYLVDYNASYW